MSRELTTWCDEEGNYHYEKVRVISRHLTDVTTTTADVEIDTPTKFPRPYIFPTVTKVKLVNLETVKPQRAGVIMYTVHQGLTYFGLGIDTRSHDLTDFGGTVMYQLDQDVINGALREFQEETLEIFEPLTSVQIAECPVVYDLRNLIIFVHLNVSPNRVSQRFLKEHREIVLRDSYPPEICGITWLTWAEFKEAIAQKGILFSRIQKFLSKARDLNRML